MPSVKISELPVLSQLSANNANTVFVVVDKTTNTTSQFSTTILAQGLYANNILNVGTANTGLLLPNSVAQFISNTAIFSQVNFQNINSKGSGDIVITSDDGDNANNYLDVGVQGSNMDPDPDFDLPNNDGYFYMHGTDNEKQGNLWIGTAVANTDVVFFTGAHKQANEIGRFEDGVGLSLRMPIKFVDGTTQNTAASAAAVTLAAQANTIITQGVDATQNTRLNSIETINTDQNTAISIIQGTDLTQNVRLNSIETVNVDQNTAISIIQGTNATQNTRLNSIETVNVDQNTAISIIQGTDLTQNSAISIIQGVDLTQNSLISIIQGTDLTQNSAISIIQGVDATQNTQIGGIQGVDLTQNSAISIIQGVDLTQNSLISIMQGVDLTQNSWISANQSYFQGVTDATNTTIGIIQGVDATQNTQIGGIQGVDLTQNSAISIIQGVDATQNTRLNSIETINTSQNTSISIIQGVDATQNTNITTANNHAWAAFTKANNALANTFSITVNNSVYIPGSLTVDGFVFANGASFVANVMSIPTTYASPQTAITLNYQQANIVKTNITSDLVVSHSNIVLGKFIDLFVYNDSASTQTITHGISANNSSTKGTTTKVQPYATKHLKYFTVDSNLANTYVIIATDENYVNGDLTITGNVLTQGTISLNNSSFAINTAFVKITSSDNFVTQAPSNTNYMLHITGKANSVTRVVVDSFGQNTYPLFAGRMGRGSAATPAAVANNDVLMRIVGNGWTGTQFPSSSPSKIDFVAAENFSNTNRGTRIEFWNTPIGSNTIQEIASFNADRVDFLGELNPLKGFIYTPVIYPNAQTAITIDLSNGPLIRAQTTSGLVVTLTNFVAGKVVELWVTNLAGSTQTFTHGVSAINSTVGATTVTMPGNSTLSARYVCLDGTLANTMCAITKG